MELSETSLGHAKLSELFQDARLRNICTVRLHGHGYVVVPVAQQSLTQVAPPPPAQTQSMVMHYQLSQQPQMQMTAQHQPPTAMQFMQTVQPMNFLQFQCNPMRPAENTYHCGANSFNGLNVASSVEPPLVMAQVHHGTPPPPPAVSHQTGSLRERARCAPLCLDEIVMSGPSPNEQPRAQPVALPATEACSIEASPVMLGQTSPLQFQPQGQALPRLLGNLHGNMERFGKQAQALIPAHPQTPVTMHVQTPVGQMVPSTPEAWPMLLTPSTHGNLKSSVQNTFVHWAAAPATPATGAACRAHSLPRNMGSKGCILLSPAGKSRDVVDDNGERNSASPQNGSMFYRHEEFDGRGRDANEGDLVSVCLSQLISQ